MKKPTLMNRTQEKKHNFIVGKKKTTRFVICLNWLLKKNLPDSVKT